MDYSCASGTSDLAAMRVAYNSPQCSFTEQQLVAREPFAQFASWFAEARSCPAIAEPNAMCLSTATADGRPSARFVLLKGVSAGDGFCFYTNYQSRKAAELDANPRAALTFYWEPLHRSVRVEGRVQRMSAEQSDAYFRSRPYDSQIAASVARQSAPIASRDTLTEANRTLRQTYPANDQQQQQQTPPRPPHWGGYRVLPEMIEFWQGQSDRMHDRIRFRLAANVSADEPHVHAGSDGWAYDRLAP